MKKFLVIALLFGIYQNWGSITGLFAGEPEYDAASNGVVLYATQWCRYCDKTRKLFAKHGISYVEYDIERSAQAHREYKKLGGRGVPVVNAYGTVIHGYSPQKILTAARAN
jgi:glutaredoxin